MKMTQSDFNELQELVNSKLANVTKKQLINLRKNIKFSQCQFTSFVWYLYHRISNYELNQKFYKYLNDAHIETALKVIFKEYK